MEQTKVFVYGTLRKGEGAHYFLEQMKAKFVGRDSVAGRLVRVLHRYPGLIPGDGLVPGEVYEIPITGLLSLDTYESVDAGLYHRRRVPTTTQDMVWAYFAGGGGLEPGAAMTASPLPGIIPSSENDIYVTLKASEEKSLD